jgi:hypothetical protein
VLEPDFGGERPPADDHDRVQAAQWFDRNGCQRGPAESAECRPLVPTRNADELDGRTQYIVDGTLLPYWSWASHPQLYSGKHKTTGMNVQVACTLGPQHARRSAPRRPVCHDTQLPPEEDASARARTGPNAIRARRQPASSPNVT